MELNLDDAEARLLDEALVVRLAGLRTELVHTDNRAFREGLREDVERLEQLEQRVQKALAERRKPGRQPL